MSKYVKDEINFHNFFQLMRQLHDVTLEQACEGLCSVSMMKRIETGERLPDKQMRDRILSRMGVPLEGYEDYLSTEEYEQWFLRQKLHESIEKKNIYEAEEYLDEYKVYEKKSAVEAQYCKAMELMLLQMKKAPKEKQRKVIEGAVALTMTSIQNVFLEKMLLSEQEINLLIEYVWLRACDDKPEGEFGWRYQQYKNLLDYIRHSHLDNFCRAKVYPKAAYYLCKTILNKSKTAENLKLGIEVCNESIELLRDSRKLYYFIELVEVLEELVKEYGFYLRVEGKREEAKKLQCDFDEKKKWYNVMKELYSEYGVEPYMENFCYLYWETESYCIGDVIRIRRQMFGMTKEQLCEGVCSVKTLTRMEHKQVKTQMAIVRELFHRLGLCPEYIRARVVTSDYEVLKLANECAWYSNNYKIKELENCLKELEQRLYLDIPQNRQFLMSGRCSLELKKKEISKTEYVKRMKEVFEYTLPLEYAMKEGEKFLSREEWTYLHNMGMKEAEKKENPYMQLVKEICERDVINDRLRVHISKYEFLVTGLTSYLGNIGEYEMSNEMSARFIKESLRGRRMGMLAENIYNIFWNYQEILLQTNLQMTENVDSKELKKCILLCNFNKREYLEKFFEEKLVKYDKGSF